MRPLTLLLALPLVILVTAIAIANRAPVALHFDPFSKTDPAFSLHAPMFVVLFATFALGLLVGGAIMWWSQRRWRRLASRSAKQVRSLERQLAQVSSAAAAVSQAAQRERADG